MSYRWLDHTVGVLRDYGIPMCFVGSGSRSTAILQAFSHMTISITPFVDERAVGFMALGYAKMARKPVVIITTSGTAATNLYPAITEAAQTRTPLIVMTADRPAVFQNTSANQTINQSRLFNNVMAELHLPETAAEFGTYRSNLGRALAAQKKAGGVIHINCPLPDPVLVPYTPTVDGEAIEGLVFEWGPFDALQDRALKAIHTTINHPSAIVCVGALEPWVDVSVMQSIMTQWGRPTIVDGTIPFLKALPHVYQSSDDAAQAYMNKADQPIVYMGGGWISKKMAALLDRFSTTTVHVSMGYAPVVPLQQSFRGPYAGLLAVQSVKAASVPSSLVMAQNRHTQLRLDRAIDQPLGSVYTMLASISCDYDMVVGNSLAIRYVDAMNLPVDRMISNRGASGIDGTIATAVGAGMVPVERPLLVLLGDLAALYDLNAFLVLHCMARPFSVVILNNYGGGIFDTLPAAATYPDWDKTVRLTHGYSLASMIATMGCTAKQSHTIPHIAFDNTVIEWVI